MGGSLDAATLAYLVENQGTAKWIVAVQSANTAAPIELSTGLPVLAAGGFSGSDPALTLDQAKALIKSGQLRFVMTSGAGGQPGGAPTGANGQAGADGQAGPSGQAGADGQAGASSLVEVSSWVASSCTAVTVGSSSGLYDCAGAVQ